MSAVFTQHLPSKPHPLPSVAALGEVAFYYEHRPGEVSENETNTQQFKIQGRASVEGADAQGMAAQLMATPGSTCTKPSSNSSSSKGLSGKAQSTKLEDPPWLLEHKKTLSGANKLARAMGTKKSEAHQALTKLAMKLQAQTKEGKPSPITRAYAEELKDKLGIFEAAHMQALEVLAKVPANPLGEAQALKSREHLNQSQSEMGQHLKSFGAFLVPIVQHVA